MKRFLHYNRYFFLYGTDYPLTSSFILLLESVFSLLFCIFVVMMFFDQVILLFLVLFLAKEHAIWQDTDWAEESQRGPHQPCILFVVSLFASPLSTSALLAPLEIHPAGGGSFLLRAERHSSTTWISATSSLLLFLSQRTLFFSGRPMEISMSPVMISTLDSVPNPNKRSSSSLVIYLLLLYSTLYCFVSLFSPKQLLARMTLLEIITDLLLSKRIPQNQR